MIGAPAGSWKGEAGSALDNGGFASIGGLSRAVGCDGFLTAYLERDHATGDLAGAPVAVDFCASAASRDAAAVRVCTPVALREALATARGADRTTAIVIPIDPQASVGSDESWWDVPTAEV